jgi:mannose-1-phosphate guanylyltransferase
MEAVILAGGFGTRIRPLTYFRPKPLLPVANIPMLQRILDQMPKEVETVLFPVNYLKEQIEAYFEERPDPRVVLVTEDTPLGTGGAIKNCQDHLTGPFLVYNGDIMASIDLAAFAEQMRKKKALAGVSLWPVKEPWHFGVVETGEGDRIKRFVEKPPKGQEPSNLINAGHYYLDPVLLDRIETGKMVSLERQVYEPMARNGEAIFGHRLKGYWVDCGRPETLLEAHKQVLAAEGKPLALGQDVDASSTALVSSYAVGDGCRIGARARILRSCLLAGVEVGADVVIEDSIIGEGAVLEDGTIVRQSVVADYAIVESGSRIEGQRVGLKPEHVEA